MPVARREKMPVQDGHLGMMHNLCLRFFMQVVASRRKYFNTFINLKLIGKFWMTGKELLL